jgi:hypothetical protein
MHHDYYYYEQTSSAVAPKIPMEVLADNLYRFLK